MAVTCAACGNQFLRADGSCGICEPDIPIRATVGGEMTLRDLLQRVVVDLVHDTIVAAEKKHGPLSSDRTRAFTVLSAEVGEVARAVLGTTGSTRPATDDELSLELLQVAATAIQMLLPMLAMRIPDRLPGGTH
jgi:hypothetical protein